MRGIGGIASSYGRAKFRDSGLCTGGATLVLAVVIVVYCRFDI